MFHLDSDDYLEVVTWKLYSDHLDELWEDWMLEFEREFVLGINCENTIISTGWSVPLKQDAMDYLREFWHSILLDINIETIKSRLERMKVDRIIGMSNGKNTLDQTLAYRKEFYEKSYDFRFTNDGLWTKDEIFEEFYNFFCTLPISDKFISSELSGLNLSIA